MRDIPKNRPTKNKSVSDTIESEVPERIWIPTMKKSHN